MHNLVKSGIAVASMAVALGGAGAAVATASTHTGSVASASTALYSDSHTTKTLISSKCYVTHSVTDTYYGYKKASGGYVPLPAPRVTTSTSTHCHA